MKKTFLLILFVFMAGLFFYGCNEEPNSIQPETSNSQIMFKGTETLGDPEITIAEGSGYIISGTGLVVDQTGTIDISSIPSGSTVKQVLLYWSGGFDANTRTNGDNTIEVNGVEILGESIGGTTLFYQSSGNEPVTFESFRADITTTGFDWTALSSLAITGMDNGTLYGGSSNPAYTENDGAGVLIIYDDGSPSEIQLLDGQDLAYKYFGGALKTTVPQTFNFTPANVDRAASLGFFAGSVALNRPNVTRVNINGVDEFTNDLFGSNDGADWDSPVLPIVIPAGVSSITVELISDEHGMTGVLPASLLWVTAALSIDIPENDPGCTLTQGYWKTHANPNKPKKFDDTWLMYMTNGAHNDFYGSGYTYLSVMEAPSSKNAYFILAQQYVAALLNKAAGTFVPTVVADALSEAHDLYSNYLPNQIKGLKGDDPLRKRFINASEILDDYNNGRLGVPHCDD